MENDFFNYYALVNNGIVENVIVCHDDEAFRELTESFPMGMIKGEWVKCTEETGRANPGWTYLKEYGKFIDVQPYPSWKLSDDFFWEPPVPQPEGIRCIWDESSQSWIEHDVTITQCTECT